ncbi:MAG: DUF4294 domain-containing protein [Flavobacteriaceae bacterium]|nr:DUF4294 domain-containing protein [Flavobacteriaceae bacterium]
MNRGLIALCFIFSFLSNAQESSVTDKSSDTIKLEEVKLLGKIKFKSIEERNHYRWFRMKVRRAYPYSVLVAENLTKLNDELDTIKRSRDKKRHIKKIQKFLKEDFEPKLKKLTRTEGRILIKLIHRHTGHTTYDLVKSLRSKWRAFWYQTTAVVFRLSLKTEYKPKEVAEDIMIEDILQRDFLKARLEDIDKVKIDIKNIKKKKK